MKYNAFVRLAFAVLVAVACVVLATVVNISFAGESVAAFVITVVLFLFAVISGIFVGGSFGAKGWLKSYQTIINGSISIVVTLAAAIVAWIAVQKQIKNQLEIAQEQQRPWVAAEAETLQYGLRLRVKNGGKSPALAVCATFAPKMSPSGALNEDDLPSECNGSRSVLLPESANLYAMTFDKAQIDKTLDKKAYAYVLGYIIYEDNLYSYWTRQCWYWEIAVNSFVICSHDTSVGKSKKVRTSLTLASPSAA
jgi:hypothetical protein